MPARSNAPPSQAGRFKPRKPKPKPTPSTAVTPFADHPNDNRSRGTSSRGRGDERGRTQGRGRGRGRRPPITSGHVFFTGGSTSLTNASTPLIHTPLEDPDSDMTIHMPGSTPNLSKTPYSHIPLGRTTAERQAVAALARHGEGEEMVIGQMMDGGVGDGRASSSILSETTKDGPSPWEEPKEQQEERQVDASMAISSLALYDSDSSVETLTDLLLPPQTLPFGGCETVKQEDEDCTTHNDQVERVELEETKWMMFKFPTRLPQLDLSPKTPDVTHIEDSTLQDAPLVKVEDSDTVYEHTCSEPANVPLPMANEGYDDSLMDIPRAGKYGTIQIHRSGKAYMVIGGVKMEMENGVKCAFLQQAVSIDVEKEKGEGKYVWLGDVGKTFVITPVIQ